jgi:hypothetical protein
MLVYRQIFCTVMEDQVPSSNPPQDLEPPMIPQGITTEMLEVMKTRAREEAVRMTLMQQQQQQAIQEEIPVAARMPAPSFTPPQPKVIYLRRNLTVAELIVVFAIACGLVAVLVVLLQASKEPGTLRLTTYRASKSRPGRLNTLRL